ncbi:hypothetical protein O1F62_RS20965 [Enterobacter hormaechei]
MIMYLNPLLLIVNILFIVFYLLYLYKIKAFSMNAEPLTHQALFKAALVIPIVSFILLGGIAWSGHSLQLDGEGMNNFLNISKLPLAALSLSIPFGVIVNNIHRTIQTDKQIKEAESKNSMDRFYAHRKNTIEILQNTELTSIFVVNDEVKLAFENSYSIYKRFYPHASIKSNDYSSPSEIIDDANKLFIQLNTLLTKTEFDTEEDYYQHLNYIEECIYLIHMHYGLKQITPTKIFNLILVNDEGLTFEFRTLIKNQHCLKMNIASYWLVHLTVADLLEIEITKEVKQQLNVLIRYGINAEDKYSKWATSNLVNATIPSFRLIGTP